MPSDCLEDHGGQRRLRGLRRTDPSDSEGNGQASGPIDMQPLLKRVTDAIYALTAVTENNRKHVS